MPYFPELVIIIFVAPLLGDLFICSSSVKRRTLSPAAYFIIASPRGSASSKDDAGYGRALRALPRATFARFFLAAFLLAFLGGPRFSSSPPSSPSGVSVMLAVPGVSYER